MGIIGHASLVSPLFYRVTAEWLQIWVCFCILHSHNYVSSEIEFFVFKVGLGVG